MPHPYTEDHVVEQPAIGLFAELRWELAKRVEVRAGGAVRTRLRRSEARYTRNGFGKVSLPPPIATGGRLYSLVPISAKKIAAGCDFVRQREEKDLRKLHGAARLRKARKKSGGFDSLHPLHRSGSTTCVKNFPTVLQDVSARTA